MLYCRCRPALLLTTHIVTPCCHKFLFCFHLVSFISCIAPCCSLINRELVAWMPDPDDGTDATMFGLEEASGSGWDQFAVNERKFGYQTGWNEDFYTVRLDKNRCVQQHGMLLPTAGAACSSSQQSVQHVHAAAGATGQHCI